MMITIEPHKKEWEETFLLIKNVLAKSLNGSVVDIQHVGSTAIPNLYAKPILDIDIIIAEPKLITEISGKLMKMGYIGKGEQGIPGRFAFSQNSEYSPITAENRKWQQHHLYVCYADSLALKNHLLFREALLNDEKLVEQYSSLKKKLVEQSGMTKEKYWKQKTDFILSVLVQKEFSPKELLEIRQANS